jgi:hypothetical protein
MKMRISIMLLFLVLLLFITARSVIAQSAKPDSINQVAAGIAAQTDTTQNELVFDTIEVKGKVQKPGVIIIPKRLEPEVNQKDLERSFQKEMTDGIGEIPKPEKELQKVEQVKSIKKVIKRERK